MVFRNSDVEPTLANIMKNSEALRGGRASKNTHCLLRRMLSSGIWRRVDLVKTRLLHLQGRRNIRERGKVLDGC
jgi:hypothetical protein